MQHTTATRRRRLAGFIVLPVLITVMPSAAMVVAKRDFPDLVARAEQIAVGTVTDIHEEPDSAGTPYTLVTFSDLSVMKGEVGTTLTLRFYGGRSGDVAVGIPDMPTFTVGERDVVFVAANGTSICPLVGVWQGRFYVRSDAALGTDVVEDSAHEPVVGLTGRELVRAPAGVGTTPLTLESFRQLIADELAHPSAAR